MSKSVVVHVGLPKTGTSTIQSWLNQNRLVLASMGITYPEHPVDVNGIGPGNPHVLLSSASGGGHRVDPGKVAAALAELEAGPHSLLLLSSEFFTPHVSALARVLPHGTRFIMYVRDPLEFLESDYNQWVKRGGRRAPFRAEPDAYGGWLGHGNLERALADTPAHADLVLRPCHPELFHDGHILADLFHAAGLTAPVGGFADAGSTNRSYTLPALEFMRTVNHLSVGADLARDLDQALQRCVVGISDYTLISPERHLRLRRLAGRDLRHLRDEYATDELEPLRRLLHNRPPQREYHAQDVTADEIAAVAGAVDAHAPTVLEDVREVLRRSSNVSLPYDSFRDVLLG